MLPPILGMAQSWEWVGQSWEWEPMGGLGGGGCLAFGRPIQGLQNGIRFEICDREFLRVFLGDRTRFFFIVRVKLVKPHNSLESHVARTRFWSVHVDICDQI